MTFKPIFQEEHCEITQIGPHALKLKFSGFLKVVNLVSIQAFMSAFTRNHPCEMLLIDHSGLKVLSKDVQEYMTSTIAHIASKGVKRIAMIEAEDVFAKAGFEKIHREVSTDNITRVVFHSEKAALEWLLSPGIKPVL